MTTRDRILFMFVRKYSVIMKDLKELGYNENEVFDDLFDLVDLELSKIFKL